MKIYLSNAKAVADEHGVDYEVGLAYHEYCKRVSDRNRRQGAWTYRDSFRSRVYDAEAMYRQKFPKESMTIEEMKVLSAKVFDSRVWNKHKTNKASSQVPDVIFKPNMTAWAGMAHHSYIEIGRDGANKFVLIHELAHTNGHRDHHQNFRACFVDFVRRFIGVEQGVYLQRCFEEKGMKCKKWVDKTPKDFDSWLKTYRRLELARVASRAVDTITS